MKKDVLLLVGGLIVISSIIVRGTMGKDSGVAQDVTEKTAGTLNNGTIEVVSVGHNGRSLVPEKIILSAGKSYDIQVTPSRDGVGCMFSATVPKIGSESWSIKAGETFSIKVLQATPGTYPVVCTSMGMKHGEIVVQ